MASLAMVSPRQAGTVNVRQVEAEIRRRVGANIKRAREAKGWTQPKLARRLGPPAPQANYISRWERGEVLPKPHYLGRLAAALEVDIAYFYGPTDANAAT